MLGALGSSEIAHWNVRLSAEEDQGGASAPERPIDPRSVGILVMHQGSAKRD